MTAKEILIETVEYYGTHNTGYDNGYCVYKTDKGAMCAVGRCLAESAMERAADISGNIEELIDTLSREKHLHSSHDEALKPEYHGKTLAFWHAMQQFHDQYLARLEQEGVDPRYLFDGMPTTSLMEHAQKMYDRILGLAEKGAYDLKGEEV